MENLPVIDFDVVNLSRLQFALTALSWILGLGFALAFGVLNAIWYEVGERDEKTTEPTSSEL